MKREPYIVLLESDEFLCAYEQIEKAYRLSEKAREKNKRAFKVMERVFIKFLHAVSRH